MLAGSARFMLVGGARFMLVGGARFLLVGRARYMLVGVVRFMFGYSRALSLCSRATKRTVLRSSAMLVARSSAQMHQPQLDFCGQLKLFAAQLGGTNTLVA